MDNDDLDISDYIYITVVTFIMGSFLLMLVRAILEAVQ